MVYSTIPAIDRHALNGIFDSQKKWVYLFDFIFDKGVSLDEGEIFETIFL
jgi:hypothetical protein